ncbi:hypothetical protein DFH06DRAFT_1325358 [Mycena polygramma]|nr:hypothetical protein DFH06DRAFT_1325358 [Mycena polygramma]
MSSTTMSRTPRLKTYFKRRRAHQSRFRRVFRARLLHPLPSAEYLAALWGDGSSSPWEGYPEEPMTDVIPPEALPLAWRTPPPGSGWGSWGEDGEWVPWVPEDKQEEEGLVYSRECWIAAGWGDPWADRDWPIARDVN